MVTNKEARLSNKGRNDLRDRVAESLASLRWYSIRRSLRRLDRRLQRIAVMPYAKLPRSQTLSESDFELLALIDDVAKYAAEDHPDFRSYRYFRHEHQRLCATRDILLERLKSDSLAYRQLAATLNPQRRTAR